MNYVIAIWLVLAIYFLGVRNGQCCKPFSLVRFFTRLVLVVIWPLVLFYGILTQKRYYDEHN